MWSEGVSIFALVFLAFLSVTMLTAIFVCYAYIFRDYFCPPQPREPKRDDDNRRSRTKKRRKKTDDSDDDQKPGNADVMALGDLTQPADIINMPTESENL